MNWNKAYFIDVIDGLKSLEENCADIIIIDPPYNIKKDFGVSKDNMDLKDYIIWCKKWIEESERILKDTGTFFIYGFSEILAYISIEVKINHRWLIWHYTNRTVPSSNFWQRSHESIIVAWKENRIFNKDLVREPYTESFINNAAGKIRKNTIGRFSNGEKETIYKANENGALPRDVIKIPSLAGGAGIERWFYCKNCDDVFFNNEKQNHKNCEIIYHPTQKPLKLTEKLILSCKPEHNGNIVIPFIGSGSEALVSSKLGLNFIGFDLNEDFVLMTNKLINKKDIVKI